MTDDKIKEELQDKNNKWTKEDYRNLNGIYDGFQENMEQIEKPKPYILKSKENQMSNKEDSEKIFIACMLMGLLLFAFALISHVLEVLL